MFVLLQGWLPSEFLSLRGSSLVDRQDFRILPSEIFPSSSPSLHNKKPRYFSFGARLLLCDCKSLSRICAFVVSILSQFTINLLSILSQLCLNTIQFTPITMIKVLATLPATASLLLVIVSRANYISHDVET